ncbi:unnamed protein product [Sphagnum troendelagicum]|uniref:B3 domain-containing transcription repressor VAL2 n=1 Tax=Sphagnum jensenii TaxID=128206 RepID=A0ABP0WD37_9BRYO
MLMPNSLSLSVVLVFVVVGGVQESAAVRTKVCWNVKCGTSSSTNWRPGWLLRAGHTADLCDSCGLAYEQSRFCETFHSDDAGWRTCNSCKKRVHCGCIASVYGLVLLDKGGVECSGCVREDDDIASSTSLPPSSSAAACEPHANNARGQQLAAPWDPDLKIEQQLMESSRSLRPAAKFQDQEMGFPSNLELHANNLDSSMKSVAAACSPKETRETAATAGGGKGPPESPPGHVESSSPSSKSGTDQMPTGLTLSGGSSPVKQVTGEGGQQGGGSETGAAGESAGHGKASTTVGSYRPPRVRQLLPRPTIAGAAAAVTLEPAFDPQAPLRVARPPGEGRGRNQLLPRYWPRITDQELQQITSGDNTVITPLFEKMLSASDAGRIGRLVLPKACAEAYFPPIHQPEGLPLKIQDVTGKEWVFQFRFWPNNNSRMYVLEGVTPCIQSMRLQAGDTVTFSRLEADGKLVMGYRRAPSSLSSQVCIATTPPSNNGLPCASYAAPQSLDGWASSKGGASAKLKDSSALTLAAAAAATQQMDRKRGRPLGSKSKRLRLDTDDALLLKSSWEEAQELLRPPPSAVPTTITIDGHEFEEYSEPPVFAKKTYPNITPSGEHEQWAQCDDCSNWRRLPATAFVPLRWSCSQNTWDLTRAQCNAPQEVSNEKVEMILRQVSGQEDGKQGGGSGSGSGSMRMMLVPTVAGDIITTTAAAAAAAAAAGLDTLAQAAAATTGPVSPMRTTKHPRHRPGCSCIVCIQPPSGKGPKHKATCTCNVCVTVKRRFKTLMQRRKKRQFERESELARKKRGWARDDISDSASLLDAASRPETSAGGGGGGAVGEENPTTPLVYQSDDVGGGADEGGPSKAAATAAAIDLNSQPDRDERVSMVRLVQDAGKPLSTYLHQQHLMTLCAPDHPLSDKVSEEEDPNSSSSREEVASQTSSKAHADSGMQLVAAAAVTPMQQGQQQQPQSPFMVDIAELSSHMESWDPRAVKPVAEPSGDSVHSSSSKQEYNMLNQLVVSNAPASSKKYATGAGRGRQICSGCGEPIGSAAKVCRRCGTSTAFGKKKRSVPP